MAPIVFHTIHDTFLFFVQAPASDTAGAWEHVVFFAALWLMVGVACLVTRFAADRLGVRAEARCTRPDGINAVARALSPSL